MGAKLQGGIVWLALASAVHLAGIVGAWFWLGGDGQPEGVDLFAAAVLVLALVSALAVFAIVAKCLFRPARRLAVDMGAFSHGERRQALDRARYAGLPFLPDAVFEMAGKLAGARGQVAAAVIQATASAETEKARLASILNDLREGVVVCNWQHRVVLYNQIALRLLGLSGEMGLGRPLFALIDQQAVLHALDLLVHRPATAPGNAPFLTTTRDGRALLQGRMTLMRTCREITGYVMTFGDAGEPVAAMAKRDALLRETIDALWPAVHRLETRPDDAGPILADLTRALEQAEDGYRTLLGEWWPMSDIHSTDLFDAVIRGVAGSGSCIAITMTGLPLWLHGDSLSLVLALEALICRVHRATGLVAFDIAAIDAGGQAAIVLSWPGVVRLGEETLVSWLAEPVAPSLGRLSIGDVILHHGGRVWPDGPVDGRLSVRIALPLGQEGLAIAEILPPRPEFFDFDLLEQGVPGGRGASSLRALTYVVFDTETTGLHPSDGDKVVSLAAVRVVNGRILTGEAFNRIVNPERPIPAQSVVFHGITDEMVVGKPPLSVVLPQFKSFASDAVLVAHNAAFDLKFIRMHEADCGVAFDNVVLDTMLLSSFIDGTTDNQSLDAIAERYGVPVTDRHTALGDSLVTAAVLLRLIDALESKGIHTLDEAMTTLDITMELHNRGLVY